MSLEREIVTCAFGNYSNLVLTQYLNGHSRYDLEHDVLYRERRSKGIGGNSGNSRVARIVMLDHQHAVRIAKVAEFGGGGGGTDEAASSHVDPEANKYRVSERDMYSAIDTNGAFQLFEECEEDEEDDEGEYADIDEGRRAGKSMNDLQDNDDDYRREIEASGEHPSSDPNQQEKPIKIFDLKDRLVPWWKYIEAPIDFPDCFSLLQSPHNDPMGMSLLHSFGHGMNQGRMALNAGSGALGGSSDVDRIVTTYESIRKQLEQADGSQGVQLIAEADGCMGGITLGAIRYIRDECGSSHLPIITHAPFVPCNIDIKDDFANTRADEVLLNRALSMHYLGNESTLYIPYHLDDWQTNWSCPFLDDNVSTAQLIASAIDTGFYGARDVENFHERCNVDPKTGKQFDDEGVRKVSGSSYHYLMDYAFALKPQPCLKVCSAFAALPMDIRKRRNKKTGEMTQDPDFSEFLQEHPLLQESHIVRDRSNHMDGQPATYVPLTHGIRKGCTPESDGGAVHGQTITLRGMAALEDMLMPRYEAAMRHLLYPTRCSQRAFLCVTTQGYPVSNTFPAPSFLAASRKDSAATVPSHTPMGVHLATTNSAASLISGVVTDVAPVIKYKRRMYSGRYYMEDDEWLEVTEGLEQLRDDYDYRDPNAGDNDDDI